MRLHEQGLIYRGTYIVNWDPIAQTAVSDLEVDSEERAGKLYHIRYRFADSPDADSTGSDSPDPVGLDPDSIVIATTRPETLLGDVAVAVNPSDERYRHLVGRQLRLPLTGRTIPLIADSWPNPEFGTGAVKVTPAHDINDYAIGQRHSLPSITMLDKSARIDLPEAATGDNDEGRAARARYQGLDRLEARERMLGDLEVEGLLVRVEEHTVAVPVSQRTGAVIEPRLSEQWFLRIQPLAEKAVAAVREGHIRFTPAMYAKTYFEWMTNIHDWCLSRQLWWGQRIPAWYCDGCGKVVVARNAPASCAACGGGSLTQDPDALDTWFSSGLLPFTVFGWPEVKPDLQAFYPTDLLVTGSDILFFWVARMIMLGTHFMAEVPMPDGAGGSKPRTQAESVPFREVYIHSLVRAADRQKMSKTKGNVLDPIEVIERFGTDAVRFTLASMASPGTDIAFSEERTDGYRAFANKIWNAARFLLMNLERGQASGYKLRFDAPADEAPLETRWIVSRLSAVCGEVDRALAAYRFDEAASAVYRFFWGEFCDWYLELVKVRLEFAGPVNATTQTALDALLSVYEAALRLLSPFMPFLTEEIWHVLYAAVGVELPARSIALTRYPTAADFATDEHAESTLGTLQELIVAIRVLRKEAAVPEKEATAVRVFSSDGETTKLAVANAEMLARMARVSEVEAAERPLSGNAVRSTPYFDVQVSYERVIDVAAERERLQKDFAKYEKGLSAAEKQLGNEAFISRAPAHIVDGLKKQAGETRALYDKTVAALAELG